MVDLAGKVFGLSEGTVDPAGMQSPMMDFVEGLQEIFTGASRRRVAGSGSTGGDIHPEYDVDEDNDGEGDDDGGRQRRPVVLLPS